ncbi:hypothetical protein SKAU_G00244150 [Synaphobranchus kaupii]|uniref:Sterile alpha motif domain-containing protein 3-like n=1 Tax=Synaphobranchus kaupii TaxID=118154 RepID=A0A9Q1F1U8_SYNKA|nr:hypothetical protein SKAU_G00244150 [Synaphobranchus kaupii]
MDTSEGTLKLRVIIDDTSTRKISLPYRPDTVCGLMSLLKEKLDMSYDFRLQFEDPEFDKALCDLENMADLPSIATVKVVRIVEVDVHSTSTEDTVLLSDVSSPERASRWPDVFITPTFSYEVEFALREGNCSFVKEGRPLKLTRDQKHNILERISGTIYNYKAYPNDTEFSKAAEALVNKHPCLKETGSKTGFDGWKNSLKFKMGNYRSKLRRAGLPEVAVNGGKRSRSSPDGEPSRANIKRPRRAEINFLPNYPQGLDATSLEALRQEMVEELKKTEKDLMMINHHMQRTFALRRQEIVQSSLRIEDFKSRWPALFREAQVYAEFH